MNGGAVIEKGQVGALNRLKYSDRAFTRRDLHFWGTHPILKSGSNSLVVFQPSSHMEVLIPSLGAKQPGIIELLFRRLSTKSHNH